VCVQGQHTHETYSGDRTKEAFEAFADSLVPSAGQPHMKHAQLKQAPRASGCNLAGTQQQQYMQQNNTCAADAVGQQPGFLHASAEFQHKCSVKAAAV
jgi:hypothetical protein